MAVKYTPFKKDFSDKSVNVGHWNNHEEFVFKRNFTKCPGFKANAPDLASGVFSPKRQCSFSGNLRRWVPKINWYSKSDCYKHDKKVLDAPIFIDNDFKKKNDDVSKDIKHLSSSNNVGAVVYFLSRSDSHGDVLKPLCEGKLNENESSYLTANTADNVRIACKVWEVTDSHMTTTVEEFQGSGEKNSAFKGFLNSIFSKCQGDHSISKAQAEMQTVSNEEKVTSSGEPGLKCENINEKKPTCVNVSKDKTENIPKHTLSSVDILVKEYLESEAIINDQSRVNKLIHELPGTSTINYCSEEMFSPEICVNSITHSKDIKENEIDVDNDEREILDKHVFEAERRLAWKRSLSEANKNVAVLRPDELYFAKLDSSVKKNTAFVRKLKHFTSNQLESLLKDMTSLNLSKYLSEVASAIVQSPLKVSDIAAAVELCNSLHHSYIEFSSHLYQRFQRHLMLKDDDQTNLKKLNIDLKFFTELMAIGIFNHEDTFPLIYNILTIAVNMDKEEHNNLNVILSFYHHCEEGYAVPRKIRNLAEKYKISLPKYNLLSEQEFVIVKNILKDYYNSLKEHITNFYSEIKMFDSQNKNILHSKGELNAERKEKWETMKLLHEKLLLGLKTLSEALGEQMPQFCDTVIENISSHTKDCTTRENQNVDIPIWEDIEEQNFYELLPDLKEYIPYSPLKEKQSLNECVIDEKREAEDDETDSEVTLHVMNDRGDTKDSENATSLSATDTLQSFIYMLTTCMNCDMIDNLAVEFAIYFNNKKNKKKIVKTILSVPRTKINLLPFYARFVAVLYPVIPEISIELCQLLKRQLKYHIRKKDQINIESKLKVVRFFGELVKFKMYTVFDALFFLKMLLRDFTHHNIEMVCTLFESCGRFLFRYPDSNNRTKVYLDQMMRLKSVSALESRYVTMIENAFYHVNPPDIVPVDERKLPPMHEFIKKLLHQDLSRSNIDYIIELLNKVNWEDPELTEFCISCLTMAHMVKYNNIGYLASIVSGLTCEEEEFIRSSVLDAVMEDIRWGMEINLPKFNQRRLSMIKYLGELYKYCVARSSEVFQILYSLISFGVSLNYSLPSYLDPPDHLFRIRLCCVLLETCGQYFNSEASNKKLNYYLTYFQRYFLFKFEDTYWDSHEKCFPVGIHYLYEDTLFNVHPDIYLFKSFKEADKAVHIIENNFATELPENINRLLNSDNEIFPIIKSDLETIREEGPNTKIIKIQENIEENNLMDQIMMDQNNRKNEDFEECKLSSENEENYENCIWNTHKENHVEDDNFMSAFDKMVSENIHNHMIDMVKPQNVEIPVPLNMKNNNKKTYSELKQEGKENSSAVTFLLLTKKGHKQQYKILNVPNDSDLAINLKSGTEAEKAEKEQVKQLTLGMSHRLEEENYKDILDQTKKTFIVKFKYDKRQKYQHSKENLGSNLFYFKNTE